MANANPSRPGGENAKAEKKEKVVYKTESSAPVLKGQKKDKDGTTVTYN
tara:strand:+ start:557 stop:703 length:147 start_codon:yes stop_codon:yes gene_type:complete